MASSEEEGEIQPDCITNYHLTNFKGNFESFSVLPLHWNDEVLLEGLHDHNFLAGIDLHAFTPIYKKVTAWKFELHYDRPVIYVLTKDRVWIKLLKPRKDYIATVKTVLVSLHCLNFLKCHPGESGESLWNRMRLTLGTFEILPSESDLLDHISIFFKVAEKDKDVSKSKYLSTLLKEDTGKIREKINEKDSTRRRQEFITDDTDDRRCDYYYDEDVGGGRHDAAAAAAAADDDDDDAEDTLLDHVCALCDNGGELLCCEGRCLRSFHPTVDSGSDSYCQSLGLTDDQVEAIVTFWCNNCKNNRHQCSCCGLTGSADRSAGAEMSILWKDLPKQDSCRGR